MSELRLVSVVCLIGMIAAASFWNIHRAQQAKTESFLPPIQETLPEARPKTGPTRSEIVNNAPLIGIVGEPKYVEDFEDHYYPLELSYSVTYETKADHEVVEDQLSKHLESYEYALHQEGIFEWYVPLDTT